MSLDTKTGTMGLRPWTLIASAARFAGNIATCRYLKPREGEKEADGPETDAS